MAAGNICIPRTAGQIRPACVSGVCRCMKYPPPPHHNRGPGKHAGGSPGRRERERERVERAGPGRRPRPGLSPGLLLPKSGDSALGPEERERGDAPLSPSILGKFLAQICARNSWNTLGANLRQGFLGNSWRKFAPRIPRGNFARILRAHFIQRGSPQGCPTLDPLCDS